MYLPAGHELTHEAPFVYFLPEQLLHTLALEHVKHELSNVVQAIEKFFNQQHLFPPKLP